MCKGESMLPKALLRCCARRRIHCAVVALVCALAVFPPPYAYAEPGSIPEPESVPASPGAASSASVIRARAELGVHADLARRERLAANVITLAAAVVLV